MIYQRNGGHVAFLKKDHLSLSIQLSKSFLIGQLSFYFKYVMLCMLFIYLLLFKFMEKLIVIISNAVENIFSSSLFDG